MSSLPNGEFLTILMIGLALSMDAFSLGIALGAQGLRWRDIARLACMISAFHVALPLCSIWIGDLLHTLYGTAFQKTGAVLLLFLGSRMTIEAIRRKGAVDSPPLKAHLPQLMMFAFGVSIDALSVGFSLGAIEISPVIASVTFGALSGLLSLMGLYLGRKVNQALGEYGQIAGGAVLIILGMKIFW